MGVKKHQIIRILDVVLIGPVMIYVSQSKALADDIRAALLIFGVATIFYNANNFIKEFKLEKKHDV